MVKKHVQYTIRPHVQMRCITLPQVETLFLDKAVANCNVKSQIPEHNTMNVTQFTDTYIILYITII